MSEPEATEPGRREYESWEAWLRGDAEQAEIDRWENLDDATRRYWIAVEKENGRG